MPLNGSQRFSSFCISSRVCKPVCVYQYNDFAFYVRHKTIFLRTPQCMDSWHCKLNWVTVLTICVPWPRTHERIIHSHHPRLSVNLWFSHLMSQTLWLSRARGHSQNGSHLHSWCDFWHWTNRRNKLFIYLAFLLFFFLLPGILAFQWWADVLQVYWFALARYLIAHVAYLLMCLLYLTRGKHKV